MSSEEELRNVDLEIIEYHALIDHFIQLNDNAEVKYWRRALQIAKLHKRRIRNS